jgi:rare lipoprotein A
VAKDGDHQQRSIALRRPLRRHRRRSATRPGSGARLGGCSYASDRGDGEPRDLRPTRGVRRKARHRGGDRAGTGARSQARARAQTQATPAAKDRAAAPTSKPSAEKNHTTYYGSASYYSHHTRTASGERFNPRELTAAHRTLPFGTRVRVTELTTGRSVTVRINDRGPFIAGRIVDVSKSAAEELGMVGRGIARVKLDVVDD